MDTLDEGASKHVVVISRDGDALRPERSPRTAMSGNEFSKYVSDMLREMERSPGKRRLLLYVHGGLNTYSQSLDRAKKLTKLIAEAGYYPIFVNWRSGLVDCYVEHLFRVRQGRIHRQYWWITWLYYLVADVGRALFRFPAAFYLQVINDCKPYMPGSNPDWLNSTALFIKLRKRYEDTLRKGDGTALGVSLGTDRRTPAEKWILLVRLLVSVPVKVVSGAIVDAFGTSAWGNMLRRTKALFRKPQEFDIRDKLDKEPEIERALDTAPTGAFSLFLRKLSEKVKSDPSSYEITLVGHSMGTIVLNRLMKDFPSLPCAHIVYMGAACSIADFVDSVVPYLESNSRTRFFNLCLHPVAEESESNALEVAPRGSLLVWIDNFLSSPETTPDRRLGVWENVLQATHMIPQHLRGRICIKGFSAGRTAGKPQKHSEFGDIEFWRPELWEA
jgi:hypothetical protein